jgi:hypothetical protein
LSGSSSYSGTSGSLSYSGLSGSNSGSLSGNGVTNTTGIDTSSNDGTFAGVISKNATYIGIGGGILVILVVSIVLFNYRRKSKPFLKVKGIQLEEKRDATTSTAPFTLAPKDVLSGTFKKRNQNAKKSAIGIGSFV